MSTDGSPALGRRGKGKRPWEPTGRTTEERDKFWSGYEPNVRRYAANILDGWRVPTGQADVDDVTSEVYLSLCERWAEVRKPVGFCKGQVKAAAGRALRRETRRGPSLDDCDDLGLGGVDLGVEDAFIEAEDQERRAKARDALPDAMATLPSTQREAVEQCVRDRVPRAKVAAKRGVSIGTINRDRERGLEKLRGALDEYLAVVLAVVVAAIVGLAAGVIAGLISYAVTSSVSSAVLTGGATCGLTMSAALIAIDCYMDR